MRVFAALVTLLALAAAGAYLATRRASAIVTTLLEGWGNDAVAEASDSVYRLAIGKVDFNWSLRRVTVDSMRLTTNGGRNSLRAQPLANLQIVVSGCRISGVHMIPLLRGRGLDATAFGCDSGAVAVVVPPRTAAAANARANADTAAQRPRGFLVLQRALKLPESAPRIRIASVMFPQLGFDFRLQRAGREDSRLQLERLEWRMTDMEIDPSNAAATARPLFSRTVHADAANFFAHPDSGTTASVAALHASLTDSTVELLGAQMVPWLDEAAFSRASPYNRTRIEVQAGRVVATGLDFGALAQGSSIRARRIEFDSVRVDAYKDKRRPPNPVRRVRRTPQAWIADLDGDLNVDSLVIRNSRVTYRERRAGRDKPGVLTFSAVNATGTNIHHVTRRQTTADPMTLAVSATLQNAGALKAKFTVPLDASHFAMQFKGTLGPMPATGINSLVEELFAMRVDKGSVDGVDFDVAVENGVALGKITPRFTGLSVSVTKRGSSGILGGTGKLGGAARGLVSFAANLLKVRANNPDNAKTPPRVGNVLHAFEPHETLPSFVWVGLRDALLGVVTR